VARLDVLKAQVDLAQAENNLLSNQRDIANARAALNRLIGRPLGLPVEPADTLAVPGELPPLDTLVALARARRPELLILDEPSEGLDPVSIEEMLQSLVVASSEGTTVFFSSHQIADVERIADRVCVINRGRVVADLALDRMRQDYRRVTVGFDSDAKLPLLPVLGIQNMRIDGRQATFIANQNSQDIAALANGLGAVSVDVQPVSLRELFLEYAKDPQG
jgi:ABC-2 type transport system ATP-binding protein